MANVAGEQVRHEQFRDSVLLVEQTHHQRLLNSIKSAIRQRGGRCETQRLASKASLTEELVVAQNTDDRFLALLGCHREFYLATLEIPHGVPRVALYKDCAVRSVFQNGFSPRDSSEEGSPIHRRSLLVCYRERWHL